MTTPQLERSMIAEKLDRIIELLESIKKQGEPILTVEDAKARLGPIEYQRALHAKIEQTPLAEIFDATLDAQGKTVDDLFGAKVLPKPKDEWRFMREVQKE